MPFSIQWVEKREDGREWLADYVAAAPGGGFCSHPDARFAMTWDTRAEAQAVIDENMGPHGVRLAIVEVPDRIVSLLTSFHWGPHANVDRFLEATQRLRAEGLWR